MEDRHTEPFLRSDRLDHLPEPASPWTFNLPIETLVPSAGFQECSVIEAPAQTPLPSSTEPFLQGVPLLVKGRRRWGRIIGKLHGLLLVVATEPNADEQVVQCGHPARCFGQLGLLMG